VEYDRAQVPHRGVRQVTSAYYNEFDPKAVAWLRELIKQGLIAKGDVDERSIADVTAADVVGYTQCHFFAGIGGWSLALRLAGWPDNRPVWTGSCPCQPFSCAGKGLGTADARHLWPEFARLIGQCRPAIVFGEQVASKAGRAWFGGVRADLEGMGYGVGAADLCAACIGAPHIRQRLYWLAQSEPGLRHGPESSGEQGWNALDARTASLRQGVGETMRNGAGAGSGGGGVAHALDRGPQGHAGNGVGSREPRRQQSEPARSPWTGGTVACRDGKSRRIPAEPAFFPLAHGVPARVVRLRGYGNAIVPPLAAEFVKACCEVTPADLRIEPEHHSQVSIHQPMRLVARLREGMGKEVGKVTKVVGPIVGDALVDVTEGLVRVLDEKIITPLLEWFKTKPPTKG